MKIATRSPVHEAAIDAAIDHVALCIQQNRARIEIRVAVCDAAQLIVAPATTENSYTGTFKRDKLPARTPHAFTCRCADCVMEMQAVRS